MDGNAIVKTLETVNSLSKLAANVSEKKAEKAEKKTYKEGDSTNQPHNQTVEVKVGTESATPKVVKEKHETHIHKPFPETRELSEAECKLEELRLKQEHEREMARINFEIESAEYDRKRREKEQERYEKEREQQKEENKKWRKRVLIGCGIAGAVGLGCIAWDAWQNSKNPDRRPRIQATWSFGGNNASSPVLLDPIVNAEGTVE